MIRNALRRRVLFFVVITLVGLMAAPIDECDDYAFIHPGTASAHAGIPADGSSGSDQQHICTCIVCVLTTNDTFAPRLPAPRRGEAVDAVPAVPCSSAFLPAIFRPPIA